MKNNRKTFNYPDPKYLELVHKVLVQTGIEKWKGWLHWYHWTRTIEDLESIIDFIKWDNYYPKFSDKLAFLMYSLNENHIFNDWNKRISLYAAIYFIIINVHKGDKLIEKLLRELEIIASDIANNKLSCDDLKLKFKKFLSKLKLKNIK